MVELIGQLPKENLTEADRQKFVRCVAVKEQHAEIVKHEIQVIWSDYFKPEHLERYPDIHDRTWKILKLAGKNKQNIDAQAAADLEAAVKEFADIFWSTKK
jgi:nickel superoxide dismutase